MNLKLLIILCLANIVILGRLPSTSIDEYETKVDIDVVSSNSTQTLLLPSTKVFNATTATNNSSSYMSSDFTPSSSWKFPASSFPFNPTDVMMNDGQGPRSGYQDYNDDHFDEQPFSPGSRYSSSKPCKGFKKPRFVLEANELELPKFISGHYGHRHDLRCPHKKGCPKADVTWYKNGTPIEQREFGSGMSVIRINKKGDKLTIEDNRPDDDGYYTCKISNIAGNISHTFKVTSVARYVAAAPQIQPDQPGNHTVYTGSNHTMLCQLKIDDPTFPHHITWFKHFKVNGSWEDPVSGHVYVTKLQDTSDNPPDDQALVLTNIDQDDEGWYSCIVSNQYDRLISYGSLTVEDPPPPSVDTSLSPLYIYLSVGIGGGLGLILLIVVIFMCIKYQREKKCKLQAVENARCVARWTKKIIIERHFVADIEAQEELLTPIVRVEKVLATGDHDVGENPQEVYEFQVDEDWEFPRECIELGEELGHGAFGKVVLGLVHGAVIKSDMTTTSQCHLAKTTLPTNPITVAVKMSKDNSSEQEVLDLVKEIEIMKAVGGHVNIVNLLGACTQPSGTPLLAILEFAEHGNLRDYLRRRRGLRNLSLDGLESDHHPVGLKEMCSFAWQVARGMEFLANRRCVHRDLAARNVLIARGGVAKVADFGLARDIEHTDYYRKVTEGKLPVLWMSPESLFDGVSTTKSDVWSFGVLLWEIVTCGERPYTGVATEALLDLIKDGYRMSIPLQCPQDLYNIMRNCWQMKPSSRPCWSKLVNDLLVVYHDTSPGVYLDLELPCIPTPPSSPDTSDTEDNDVVNMYKTVTSVVSGIAPLLQPRMPIQKRFSSCSDFLSETSEANRSFTVSRAETGVYSNSSSDTGECVNCSHDKRDGDYSSSDNRDSLESGYSSGGKKSEEYLPMESKTTCY